MKHITPLSISFTLTMLLLTPNLAVASFTPEAGEISCQINNSDHIIIGTVSEIKVNDYLPYANNTITVKEWLYNPLSAKTITVRTNSGDSNDAMFTLHESVLFMLKDQRPDLLLFLLAIGSPGKHPVADRDAVIKELKAQGKWKGENQTENEKNESGIAERIGSTSSAGDQEDKNQEKQNNVPGFSIICGLSGLYLAYKIRS